MTQITEKLNVKEGTRMKGEDKTKEGGEKKLVARRKRNGRYH